MASSSRVRIGVIVDRGRLARWQMEALRTLADEAELLVYSCRNTQPSRRQPKFALYYLVNLFSVRNRMTRRGPWPSDLPVAATRDFDATYQGAWQRLPSELIDRFHGDRIKILVKFGMGLLRVPEPEELPIPILSYHHGDPTEFRGRPAGFHEMLEGRPVMGQVVQRISNRLDAGEILASAESKIIPHSYRSTLVEAYRHSPLLLKRAVANALAGRASKLDRVGRNYRLPTNHQVLGLLLKQCRAAIRRVGYGMFVEKCWEVATVVPPPTATASGLVQAVAERAMWQTVAVPKGFRFLADPFFHPVEGLLVEGMSVKSCRGEIIHVGGDFVRQLSGRGGHYSYPAQVQEGQDSYIIPECSDWASAQAFPFDQGELGEPFELKIPDRPPLLDPTPFRAGGSLFLFANRADEGSSVLRLWVAENLHGEFAEHPASPIRVSPNGSRMGGSLFSIDGQLYRAGQDLRGSYGDGITLFRITKIDWQNYREVAEWQLRFSHVRGPHTLNLGGDRVAFDYYTERFNLFAWIRRLMESRAARRAR